MKHARSDYDSIQDIGGHLNIPSDEPVFLIRGQDKVGHMAVNIWAWLAKLAGAKDEIVEKARVQAILMENWKKKKVPDIPRRLRNE